MKYLSAIILTGVLLVSLVGFAAANAIQQATIPTISIVSVNPGVSVTIESHNFPASQNFTVTMGKIGTRGINGTVVATTFSGSGGTFDQTYNIPVALQSEAMIAIRLESDQGFFAFNWFNNVAVSATTPAATTPAATPQPASSSTAAPAVIIPTFTITDVIPDQQVTIETANFPANMTFTVLMGKIGTRGVNGIEVAKLDSGNGGTFQATFSIPPDLAGLAQIAIRLDGTQGFFSFNWFWNSPTSTATATTPAATSTTATPAASGTPAPTVVVPTISIISVVKDQSVTVQTANFPANQRFTVTMGKMGTRGVGGVEVGQTDSGSGGSFQATYSLPSGVAGQSQIAIRLESPQGFFAFNWFWNTTAP